MLNKETLKAHMQALGVNIPVIFYDLTDSTNTRAKEYARLCDESERTPVLFIAREQSAGRGRMGRSFISGGGGIYLSLLLHPDGKGYDTTKATAEAAVALRRAVSALSNCSPLIKWVNDLYVKGKKLAGILCEGELIQDGEFRYLVVGMGINVYKNAISNEISTIATSIEDACGIAPDINALAAQIIHELIIGNRRMTDDELYIDYKNHSLVIGNEVTVIGVSESYTARAIDIDKDYSLIVEHNGKNERLFTGEVSLKV